MEDVDVLVLLAMTALMVHLVTPVLLALSAQLARADGEESRVKPDNPEWLDHKAPEAILVRTESQESKERPDLPDCRGKLDRVGRAATMVCEVMSVTPDQLVLVVRWATRAHQAVLENQETEALSENQALMVVQARMVSQARQDQQDHVEKKENMDLQEFVAWRDFQARMGQKESAAGQESPEQRAIPDQPVPLVLRVLAVIRMADMAGFMGSMTIYIQSQISRGI